jgi:hypothetical protein
MQDAFKLYAINIKQRRKFRAPALHFAGLILGCGRYSSSGERHWPLDLSFFSNAANNLPL